MQRFRNLLGHKAQSTSAGGHNIIYTSNQGTTPYLRLPARLSQIWINRWTILLLLVLARFLIALAGINSDLATAHREALSACNTVESLGSAMASMPHYMSQGVNEVTATGVEKAVNGLFEMTTMSVTGVEEIVVFVINMMTSTYLCLITLAVSGSLHAVIGVLEDANNQLKDSVSGLGDDIANAVKSFDSSIDSVRDALKTATLGHVSLPDDLNVDDQVNKIKNIALPDGLDSALQTLNKSIPNFDQVQNFTNNAIRFPFELLKTQINNSLGTYHFDRSIFPVPQKENLSFCGENDGVNTFFESLFDIAVIAKKVALIVLIIGAILVCLPMAWRETRRWRTQEERARLVGYKDRDPMDVVYIVNRPYTSTFGIKISSKFEGRRQALVRWVVAYATTDAALFVLALGVAGLFSCLCQYIMLKSLQKEVPVLTAEIGNFADKVISQLNSSSSKWANDANAVITHTNTEINDNLFTWVNTSVDAINDTMNTFINETTKLLNTTFGGTPLYDPITEVFNCLIGLKIVGIEKALTWVEDHAHVDFPLMPSDTFTLGAIASIASDQKADSSFLANPGDVGSDKITSAVNRFVNKLYDAIRTEAFIALVLCGIWVLILLIAVVRAAFAWFGRDKTRGEGGGATILAPATPPQAQNNTFESYQYTTTPAPNYQRNDPFADPSVKHGNQETRGYQMRGHGPPITSVYGDVYNEKSRF